LECLGIESTAHTIGVGITNGDKIIHHNTMYKAKNEGIVPRKVADHHAEMFPKLLKQTLDEYDTNMHNIDCIAFSQGPGIGQCLQIGSAMARHLAIKYKKPLIGVNHCVAHLDIGIKNTGLKDPLFIYASGGNTQLIVKEKNQYLVLGETLDIGMGNLFDTFGRAAGLEFAHGGVLEKISQKGKYIGLPYTVKGMNIIFGGMLTSSIKKLKKHSLEDVTYSLMHNAFAMTIEATERALCLKNKKEIIVCGGVAQNDMFKQMLTKMADEHNVKFGSPLNEFNRDNAGMIAYTGWLMKKNNKTIKLENSKPRPNWRIDKN